MANIQIGVVLSLQGQASVTHADGAAEKLQEGSQVFLNDVVTTGKNAAVLISFLDGSLFEIGAAFTAILNTDVFDPAGYMVAGETTGLEVSVSNIGEVTGTEGDVKVVRADGTTHTLSVGDFLYANDVVVTAANSSAAAKMLDGSVFDIGPDFTAYINDDLFPSRYPDYVQAGLTDAEIIRAAILAGQDPADVGKAPAAGSDVTEDAGNSIVVIDDRGRQVTPESGHETTGLGYGFSEMEELLQSQQFVPPVAGEKAVVRELDEALLEDGIVTRSAPLEFTAGSNDIVSFSIGDLSDITVNTSGTTGIDVEWVKADATTLEGYVNGELALTVTLSGNSVLAGSTGAVTLTGTLSENFLHEPVEGPNSLIIEGLKVQATDDAGNSATGLVSVIVIDDVPTVDVLPDTLDIIEESTATSGTWTSDGGADGIATTVVYLDGDDSTTYALDTDITVTNAGGDELGVLRVNSDGTWTFNASLDVINNDEFADALDFSVRVTDGDGDVAVDTHTIAVADDGLPSGGSTTLEALDEAAITDTLGTSLSFSAGSDDLVSFKFSDDLSGMTLETDGIAGDDVEWTRVSDTLIEGRVDGELALTLELSGTDPIEAFSTGSVTVTGTLTENFIHPDGDGTNTITISGLDVVATDTDGTTATGAVSVIVVDDVPTVAIDAVAPADPTTVAEDDADISGDWSSDGGADGIAATVVYLDGNDSTTYALDSDITVTNAGGDELGVLRVNSGGSWNFDPSLDVDNDDAFADDFDFTVRVTDGDGDVAEDSHNVSVTDGTQPPEGPGITLEGLDEALMNTVDTPVMTFQAGSDALTSFVFGDVSGMTVNTDGNAGADVVWTRVSDTVIEGRVDGELALTLTLSAPTSIAANSSGDVTVTATLSENFLHDDIQGTNPLTITGATVVASDNDADLITGNVTVTVADDVPTAVIDSGAVNEGDVLTVVEADGVLSNDEFGADGAVLVGVRAAGGDTTTDASGQVGTTISGLHGTLNLSADGGYTYTSTDNGITGAETDVFVYTIEDGDGDLSTTTLTINLTDGGLVAGEADEVLVDEAALDLAQAGDDLVPGTVTGSLPGSPAETDASQTLTDNVTGGFNGDSSNYSYALVGSATGVYGTIQVNADGSYIYTLSAPVGGAPADNGSNTVDNAESFTYEVTDEVGNTAQGTIQINIADDVPTAVIDSGAVNEGDVLTVVEADGVLSNDEFGADGAVLVGVRAAGGDTTTDALGQVGTTISGLHGTLNLSADGGYTYTSTDNGITGAETDVFVYTIEDGDGDLSTTTLTVNLTDGGLVAGEADEVLVDEAALDLAQAGDDLVPGTVTGSLPGSPAETDASQTLTDNVTGGFNGDSSNYSYALVGSATGVYGTIQVNADGSYIYTLSAPVGGAPADDGSNTVDNAESFTYEVTDEVGNTAQGTIQINIVDDVPTAVIDSGAVNEGDVLTVVEADGVLSNDEFGADGAVLVGVRAAGGDTTTDALGQVGTTISGLHGTLNLSADGGYTYTSTDNGITGAETDVFVYTIEDGDGDLSTTTLTVNLTDGGLVAGEADEVLVDEAALDLAQAGDDLVPGTVTGSLPGSPAETDASQTLTDNVTGGFNGDSSNYSYALVGSATGVYGTIQVNADGSYIYTLSAPVDGVTADDGSNTVDNAESFTYEVTDEVGNTAQGTIQINIADDVPTAVIDSGAVNEGDVLTVVEADGVLSNDEFGADGAVLVGVRAAGGDTTTDALGQVGTTISGLHGTLNLSADGGYTYTSTDNGITGAETDVFVYTIEDGDGDLSTTTLTVNLTDGGLVAGEADEVLVDEAALDLAQAGDDLVPGTVTGSLPGSPAETDASQTLTDNVTGGFNGDSSNYSYALVGSATGVYGTIQVNADGSYIYTLSAPVDGVTADDGSNTVDNAESFTYEVTDEVGNTAQGTIQINIADDVPTAVIDSGAVNEGDVLTVVEADGVLSNDEFGADGAVLVGVRAAGGDTTTDASGQVGTTISGLHGTLNLSADGGYTYTSTDNGITGAETDVFVYTIEDGDGDLSTTTLTINLTDGGLVAGEADEVLVDEAALDLAQAGDDLVPGTVTGSLPGSPAETDASQTLTDNVTGGFNGDSSNYSYALVGSATGVYGTIQVNADGSYIYTLSAPVDGVTADDGSNTVDNAESFTYEVTDEVGNTAQGTIQINIADDVPTAVIDSGAVNEGDVLTVVEADGVLSNDEFGADGAVLVGVRAAGGDTTTDASGQVGTTISGLHGTLNLSADGGYTYTSTDNGITGAETDVFVYTIEDGDGDLSTTTLTINLTDGGLVAGEADEVLVDEAALDLAQAGDDLVPGTVTGSLPGSPAETDASQTLTDNVTGGFNGDSSNYSYALVGSATGVYGTIQVNADGSYIYTLSAPVGGAPADDGSNTVDNAESFTYEVTDEVGNTAQGTIQINIADDVPTAVIDSGAVNEGDVLTVVEADGVLSNDEFGADGAVLVGVRAAGGDTTTDASGQVGTTISGLHGTLNLSADGGYTYTSTDNGITGAETDVFVYTIEDGDGDLSTTTLTVNLTDGGLVAGEADEVLVDEAALDLAQAGDDLVPGTVTGSLPGSPAETDASQTLTDNVTGGFNGDSSNYSYALVGSATGVYGTIQVNADGSYIYTLSAPVGGAPADDGSNTVDNAESFTYEVTDEVGNTAQGTIQINIADDVPTAVIDSGAVNEGDVLTVVEADGVLSNDEFGADGAVLVGVRAAGGDTTTDALGQVGTTISGLHGTLNLSADGGYTYTSTDNGITGAETDVFVYTIEDGDGDLSTTTLTINLTDGGLVAGEADEVLVDEAALDLAQAGDDLVPGTVTGSLPGSPAETDASQTLTDNVTGGFNGDSSNYSYALVGSATGVYGTIQVNADGSYIYTLSAPVGGAPADDGSNTVDNAESFTYEVTDEVGNTAQGTIQINIADDVPTAVIDSGAVNEGDVLTVVEADGVLSNDEFGADGAVLVGVRAAGGDTTTDASGQVGTTISGLHGTLNLSADGGYTYTSTDNGITGAETDVFVYTIEDGDGDLSTTTLTVNLTDGGLVAGEADEVLVDEAALDLAQAGDDLVPGTVTGSLPGSPAETDASQTLTDNVTGGFNGDSSNYSYALVGSATGVYGTIQVNADGSYIYTLSAPVDGVTADDGSNTVDNAESFTYEVTDNVGNTAQGTIQINIVDDVPTASNDSVTQSAENAPVVIDAFSNDVFGADGVDIDNTPDVQVTFTQGGAAGSVVSYDAVTGLFTYTPAASQAAGDDSFTYTLEDGDGDTATATVTVTIVADSTPTVSVTDGTVDEKGLGPRSGEPAGSGELADGLPNNDSDTSETTAGTFTVTTGSDTLGALEVQAADTSWVDVTAATAGSPITVQGANGVLTVSSDGAGNYSWSYTLSDNLTTHPDNDLAAVDGDSDRGVADQVAGEAFAVRATDNEGDVSATDTLDITVNDDGPSDFSPTPAIVVNSGDATGSGPLGVFGNTGADGLGNVVFTGGTDGNILMGVFDGEVSSRPVQYLDENIELSGFGTGTLEGRSVDTNILIFEINLNPDAADESQDLYTITFYKDINDGSSFTFSDFSTAPAGQNKWIGFDQDGFDINDPADPVADSSDLVITAFDNGSDANVNTSSTDIGVNNQWMTDDQGIRIDYVVDIRQDTVAGEDERDVQGFLYDEHYAVNDVSFKVLQVSGSGNASAIRIKALEFSGTEGDTDLRNGSNNTTVAIIVSSILINGVAANPANITLDLDGSVVIEGLMKNDTVFFSTASPVEAIEISNANGQTIPGTDPVETYSGHDFALGAFGYQNSTEGSEIDLAFDLQSSDGDGDAATGTLNMTLSPDGDVGTGSGLDEVLIGDSSSDALDGGAGNDILVGNGNDDIILGNLGDDTMTGGTGSDTFVWLAEETGTDTVMDFTTGSGGDVLNLADLLVGEHGSSAANLNVDGVPDGNDYLLISSDGTDTTIEVFSDGNGAAGDVADQMIVLAGVNLTGSSHDIIDTLLPNNLITDL